MELAFSQESVSRSVVSHSLQPTRLLCPWDSAGKNTEVGCHSLLQGIFPMQRSNPALLHCRQILYHLNHQGSPTNKVCSYLNFLRINSSGQSSHKHFFEVSISFCRNRPPFVFYSFLHFSSIFNKTSSYKNLFLLRLFLSSGKMGKIVVEGQIRS